MANPQLCYKDAWDELLDILNNNINRLTTELEKEELPEIKSWVTEIRKELTEIKEKMKELDPRSTDPATDIQKEFIKEGIITLTRDQARELIQIMERFAK